MRHPEGEKGMYLPVGTVMPYAGPITDEKRYALANAGFLFCDGKMYEQNKYDELFSVIKDAYKNSPIEGDRVPAGMFRVPDYRGLFLRGSDDSGKLDVDHQSRTGGMTVTPDYKEKVGSFQSDSFKDHIHRSGFERGPGYDTRNGGPYPITNDHKADAYNSSGAQNPPGGRETRPKNLSVNYIIYAGVAKHR